LANEDIRIPRRVGMLRELLTNLNEKSEPVVKGVFEKLENGSAESVHAEKTRKLEALLKEIQEGPLRLATFIEAASANGSGVSQALVSLDDGTYIYTVLKD